MAMLKALKTTLGRAWRLARIAIGGPGAWRGLALFALVLALGFVGVWLSVRLITWNKAFYDALENMDGAEALRQTGIFFILIGGTASGALAGDWLRKLLIIRWRERLTQVALDQWIGNLGFWILRPGYSDRPIENPDQRIAEDCRQFVESVLSLTVDLITNSVAIFSYFAVLWGAAAFALSFSLFGIPVEIPHYMVWLAPIYVALSTLITHLLGRPLKQRYFQQEKLEANFRHSLVRMRDNADPIAQSAGGDAEIRRLAGRFDAVAANWISVMWAELRLGLFTKPYYYTVLRVPTFFALPAYFAGAVTLGGLMQLASAFSRVTNTLSWFLFRYSSLARFVAVCERLDDLLQATRQPQPAGQNLQAVETITTADGDLRLSGVQLATPHGQKLPPVEDVHLRPGEVLLIEGASGSGKTSLLCAIIGLWRWGQGRIQRQAGHFLLLPSGAPVMDDNLLAAVSYPQPPEGPGHARVQAVLKRAGLAHRLASHSNVSGLSMGERQRVGLARAVLNRPDWLILDEATSALDPAAEADLLHWLRQELPDASIIITAHRRPAGLVPDRILQLGTAEREIKTA